MRTRIIGNGGLILAILMAGIMSAVVFFFGNPQHLQGELGICMPSPNLWTIPAVGSWLLNLSMIILLGIFMHFFNKTYNFVNSSDTMLPAAFIFFCGANPWIDALLTSSVIMVAANLICLQFVFGCYRSQKGMQPLFIVGSVLSLCSMFQYAFVFLIPAYIIIAMVVKCLHFKSFIAMIMGVAAPYWVGIGLGIIPLESFSMPAFSNLFDGFGTRQALLIGLLNCALTITISMLLALYNAVKLYAGNTRRRLLNNGIIVLGLTAAICCVCDADNIPVYMATLYMVLSAQIANLFALHHVKYPNTTVAVIAILYIVLFVLMETSPEFEFLKIFVI